jgi:hypothetical protein
MTLTITAQDMFRQAYENRYTWDENFPGYTADVTMTTGETTCTGKVKINRDLSFEVEGIEEEDCAKAIKNQLWEITIHRVNHSFAETHGENTFALGEKDDTGAVKILVGGAGAGNYYKLRDDTVCFVHRRIGNKIVNIDTTKTLNTDKGYLALEYNSIYINPETNETISPKTEFFDKFELVGNYYLLTNRQIVTESEQPQVTEFTFTNISFL